MVSPLPLHKALPPHRIYDIADSHSSYQYATQTSEESRCRKCSYYQKAINPYFSETLQRYSLHKPYSSSTIANPTKQIRQRGKIIF